MSLACTWAIGLSPRETGETPTARALTVDVIEHVLSDGNDSVVGPLDDYAVGRQYREDHDEEVEDRRHRKGVKDE